MVGRASWQVRQLYYQCNGKKEKQTCLAEILSGCAVGQCIIFTASRDAVDTLAKVLTEGDHV